MIQVQINWIELQIWSFSEQSLCHAGQAGSEAGCIVMAQMRPTILGALRIGVSDTNVQLPT
jgi:hypothetical protein